MEEQSEEEKALFAALEKEMLEEQVRIGINFQGEGFGIGVYGTVEQCRLLLDAARVEVERTASEVLG
jgi:hypothetical protein